MWSPPLCLPIQRTWWKCHFTSRSIPCAVKYPGLKTTGKLVPKQCNVGYFLLLLLLLSLLFVSCQHLCKWYHSSIQMYNYIRHKSTNINSNLELECNAVAMRPVSWLLCPALRTRQVQCSSPLCRPPHRYTFHTSLPLATHVRMIFLSAFVAFQMAIELAKRLPFWLLSTFLEDFQVNGAASRLAPGFTISLWRTSLVVLM